MACAVLDVEAATGVRGRGETVGAQLSEADLPQPVGSCRLCHRTPSSDHHEPAVHRARSVNLALAAAIASALAALGWGLRWLTVDGAVAAAAVGATVFWGGGGAGAAILATFLASGSLLSRDTARRSGRAPEPRTAAQVLANGACAALGAVAIPNAAAGWLVLAGATAAAQADTWATEIGTRATTAPRLITTLAHVAPGTSGGVTLLGTVGGMAGAATAALVALIAGTPRGVASAALLAGVVGMVVDSLLGATVQARYRCPVCGDEIERRRHACGREAECIRGLKWIDNDVVNLLATVAGAGTAVGWGWAV